VSYGAAGTAAGTYEVDLASTTASVLQSAAGVNVTGSYAYAFVPSSPLAAGSYRATASDFQFPAPLSSLAFAVAQNHAVLKQSSAAGSVSFTAAAGRVVLLAAAAPAAGVNGLFDINVQNSSSAVAFDQIQTVSPVSGFISSDHPWNLWKLQRHLDGPEDTRGVLHVGAGGFERG